jgi:hypothetical protein
VGDKFSITVSPGDLSSAETLLGDLARNVEEEGTKLADLPGKAASWTGRTATTLKAEMTRIAGQMKSSPEHFTTAKTAVGTFRGAIEDAQTKTLPDLNRRWNESISTYDSAVSAAGREYSSTVGPYRRMPDEDSADLRQGAQDKRNRAVDAAAGVRDAEQRKLQGEYDALVRELETAATTCGSALAAAVLVAVPAEVVSRYLAGGGMGPGALDADFDKLTRDARQKLTGDESLAGRADDLKAGEELARTVGDKVRNGQPLTAEEIAYLRANARNQAFVQGFMQTMGPEALAALSYTTLIDVEQGQGDEKKNADDLKGALTDLFTTGSHIQVDDGKGGQRYLMDDGWLNNFSPAKGLPDIPGYSGVQDHGYEPGVLLPFLTQPVSENFSKVVGDRWLRDYETAKKNGMLDNFYQMYRTPIGDHDVNNIVFDRIGDHPNVSNDLMTSHTQTFMELFAGQDPFLIGGVNDEPDIRKQLDTILRRGVLEVTDPQHLSNADYIVASMGKYLAVNGDQKFIKEVLPALGDILVDDRYLTGQIVSVSTPYAPDFDPKAGFPAYNRDPNFGLLMDRDLWAQLQQDALRSPENVDKIVGATHDWLVAAKDGTFPIAFSYPPERIGPDGKPRLGPDGEPISAEGNYAVISLDLYQQAAVSSFLGTNLIAVGDDLTKEMEARIGDVENRAEFAKAAFGKIVEYAGNPAQIATDAKALTIDTAVNFATDTYKDWAIEDIKREYTGQIDGVTKAAEQFMNPDFLSNSNDTLRTIATSYQPGENPPSVYTRDTVGGPLDKYEGDPLTYVGHDSQYVNGTVMTDDFLVYKKNPDGTVATADGRPVVTGILDPSQMNSLQRQAYDNWIHDPAVQQKLHSTDRALQEAAARAKTN